MSVPLKCTEFAPYTVDFTDDSDRDWLLDYLI